VFAKLIGESDSAGVADSLAVNNVGHDAVGTWDFIS